VKETPQPREQKLREKKKGLLQKKTSPCQNSYLHYVRRGRGTIREGAAWVSNNRLKEKKSLKTFAHVNVRGDGRERLSKNFSNPGRQ